uniref:Uncharacterized protein n=1 Tax=Rhizophora mucronata TaxID=61149 RepID=A0A2P2N476_RHIMU
MLIIGHICCLRSVECQFVFSACYAWSFLCILWLIMVSIGVYSCGLKMSVIGC